MRNPTRQPKMRKQPSQKTRWAYFMQAIEPKSEAISKAFPGYHPQWLQVSQRMTIAPENFMFLRLRLGMSIEQCAAYLRTSKRTISRWEGGTIPVPFAEFELLRMVFESISFKLSHSDWDGWFISSEGKLVSPFDGAAHTPDDINLMWLTHSIKAGLEIENAELKKALADAAAENTRLRQLFLSHGVVDELYSLHDRMNELIQQLATAHVLPFPRQSSDKVEKAA